MAVVKEAHPENLKVGDKLFRLSPLTESRVEELEVVIHRHYGGKWEWTTQSKVTGELEDHQYDCHSYGESDDVEDGTLMKLPAMYKTNPIKRVKKWT